MTTLKTQNLRFALLKFVADAIKAELDNERADHLATLKEAYDNTGSKSMDVRLPNGVKVATISLSAPTAKTVVVDDEAFLVYCKANMPSAVETTVIQPAQEKRWVPPVEGYWAPATPEVTVDRVNPDMVTALLKTVTPIDATGGDVVDDGGLIVDGVQHTPAGQPSAFSVRAVDGGAEKTVLAWRAGELADIVNSPTLPALEPSNVIPLGSVHGWVDDLSDQPIPVVLDEKAETITLSEEDFDEDEHSYAWPTAAFKVAGDA